MFMKGKNMPSTERLVVLLTPEEKMAIAARAKDAKLTMGEFVRRATDAYVPKEDDSLLAELVSQVEKSTAQANKALDVALKAMADSNKRIAAMEAAHAQRASKRVA